MSVLQHLVHSRDSCLGRKGKESPGIDPLPPITALQTLIKWCIIWSSRYPFEVPTFPFLALGSHVCPVEGCQGYVCFLLNSRLLSLHFLCPERSSPSVHSQLGQDRHFQELFCLSIVTDILLALQMFVFFSFRSSNIPFPCSRLSTFGIPWHDRLPERTVLSRVESCLKVMPLGIDLAKARKRYPHAAPMKIAFLLCGWMLVVWEGKERRAQVLIPYHL